MLVVAPRLVGHGKLADQRVAVRDRRCQHAFQGHMPLEQPESLVGDQRPPLQQRPPPQPVPIGPGKDDARSGDLGLVPQLARQGRTDQVSGVIDVSEKTEAAVQRLEDHLEHIAVDLFRGRGQEDVGDALVQGGGPLLTRQRLCIIDHGQLLLTSPQRLLREAESPFAVLCAPQVPERAGQTLDNVQSLHQIVAGAEFHELDGDSLIAMSRHHDEGNRAAAFAQGVDQLGPAHVGEFDIEQQRQVGIGRDVRDRLAAGQDALGVIPGGAQGFLSQIVQPSVVLDDQHRPGFRLLCFGRRAFSDHHTAPSPSISGTCTTARKRPSWRTASTKLSGSAGLEM